MKIIIRVDISAYSIGKILVNRLNKKILIKNIINEILKNLIRKLYISN